MQIPSVPPPLITNPLPQDIAAKTVTHVQAVAPLEQRAISPSERYEKSHQNRNNQDKNKGGKRGNENNNQSAKDQGRGSAINIDV